MTQTLASDMTAKELRATLKELGWSQLAAAERMGLTRFTISRYANGAPIPRVVSAYLRCAKKAEG